MISLRSLAVCGMVCLGGFVPRLSANADFASMLEYFEHEFEENPHKYIERYERGWMLLISERDHKLEHLIQEDIDTIVKDDAWRIQGLRLQAYLYHRQGKLDEARAQVLANRKAGYWEAEQSNLLGRVEFALKDTLASIKAFTQAWEVNPSEDFFLDLVRAQKAWHGVHHGKLPRALLDKGRRLYGFAPGVNQEIFEIYKEAGDAASLRAALEVSSKAQTLWPQSVDWKLRHAKILLALGQPVKAEPVLLAALDLLEQDTRLAEDSPVVVADRKDIFALLEKSRNSKSARPSASPK